MATAPERGTPAAAAAAAAAAACCHTPKACAFAMLCACEVDA